MSTVRDPTTPLTLTLYGRGYCHLCHDMEQALRPLQEELGFALELVDVDSDHALDVLFGELVPLLTVNGGEICRYFLDEAAVRASVKAYRALPGEIR